MTAPPESVKAALAKLADLPVVAELEADDREKLQRRVRELETELKQRKLRQGDFPSQPRRVEAGSQRFKADSERLGGQPGEYIREVSLSVEAIEVSTRRMLDAALPLADGRPGDMDAIQGERVGAAEQDQPDAEQTAACLDRDSFPPGMTGILRVLCDRYPSGSAPADVTILAEMTPKSGTFRAYLAQLERSGSIDRSWGMVTCTNTGLSRGAPRRR